MLHPAHIHPSPEASPEADVQNLENQIIEEIAADALPPGNPWLRPFRDSVWVFGAVLLLVSLVLFSLGWGGGQRGGFPGEAFPINFLFVWIYAFTLIASKRLKWWLFGSKPVHYDTFFIYIALWLTSCFALNRQIPIFHESAPWLSTHLVLTCATAIGFAWQGAFPPVLRALWLSAMAWSAVLMAYFAAYLSPILPISAAVFWFFGLSLHAFVPLVFFIHLARVLWMAWDEDFQRKGLVNQRFAITAGVILPLAIAAGFAVLWASRVADVRAGQRLAEASDAAKLPSWVRISQRLRPDGVTERILKSGIYYQTPSGHVDWFPSFRADNLTRHDPLVFIADLLFPAPQFAENERVGLLKTLFDGRHELQERLWTGRDLRTQAVATRAHLEPEHRLAYTEKTLTIRNTSSANRQAQQEAFYTFYLPEGGVVTSLSLWVNGVEEPARLAAKSLADSAYRAVVGVERRDPSLISWQEGNTVTVRVFPCTPEDDRRVKIGFTTPLREDSDALVYENIAFSGPPATGTPEDVELEMADPTLLTDNPWFMQKDKNGLLKSRDKYRQHWEIAMKKPPFRASAFSFNGKTYRSTAFSIEKTAFRPSEIYLDLNAAWTPEEVEMILKSAGKTPVFALVPEGNFTLLTPENSRSVLRQVRSLRFSLFPFHELDDPHNALIISKNSGPTPNLSDLKNSDFGKKMAAKLPAAPAVRVFHLGQELSPYLRSLAEFRVLQLHKGQLAELASLLENGQFFENPETPGSVVIPSAGMRIVESADAADSRAPDHLMRLYTYNNVMRQIGAQYLDRRFEPQPLVRQAEEAFVATPVSSLVVLETQADYERFGIAANQNTLGNAALHNSGAVPEPHEWALLVLLLVALVWVWRRSGG